MKSSEDQICVRLVDAINKGAIVDPMADKTFDRMLKRADIQAALKKRNLGNSAGS